jgi:hypothetical protein
MGIQADLDSHFRLSTFFEKIEKLLINPASLGNGLSENVGGCYPSLSPPVDVDHPLAGS